MTDLLSQPYSECIRPDYCVYHFTDQIYKVIWFKSGAPRVGFSREKCNHYDKKLDSSLSRSRRVVLELALCNPWKYFCTFTIDKNKYDRFDLKAWYKKFSTWLRDQRKKYPDLSIEYVIVPEMHQDGAWHAHGLFSDISILLESFDELASMGLNVPIKLLNNGYLNWRAYADKFGFCSFAPIRDHVAVSFYITKYIDKQLCDSAVGLNAKSYYNSQGLQRSSFHGDVYGHCSYLDQFLRNHYEFCSTGFTSVSDGLTWNFAFEYMQLESFDFGFTADPEHDPDVDKYFEVVQEVIEGFV